MYFTFAVNVDDALDDIVRQFKGVSNGLMCVAVGPTPSSSEYTNLISERNLPLHANESDAQISRQSTAETSTSISDDEGDKDQNHGHKVNGWNVDDEVKFTGSPQGVKCYENGNSGSDRRAIVGGKSDQMIQNAPVVVNSLAGPDQWGDPNGMPSEVGFCL